MLQFLLLQFLIKNFFFTLQAKSEKSNASSENSDQGAPNVEAVLYTSPNSASQAQVGRWYKNYNFTCFGFNFIVYTLLFPILII